MPVRSWVKDNSYRLITALVGDQAKMVTLPILSGPGKGLKIRADLIDRKDAYFLGKYDRYILDQVMPFVQRGSTIWDCGTYIGFYTLVFARSVGSAGRVVAIEPDLRNLERTQENAALNRLTNIIFVNAAIGAPVGEVDFIVDDGTNSHLPGTYAGGLEMEGIWNARDNQKPRSRVECISLDQALLDKELPKPDLIKLDIEGAEKDALQHAVCIFEQVRPLLLLELHNPECDRAAWDFSRRFRYELTCLDTGEVFTKPEEVHGTVLCRPR
jgi:FkbM family methyltransferase